MKKMIVMFIVGFILCTGCTSESEKIELLDNHLSELYSDYIIINSCGYTNTGGDDDLESIGKINDDYVLFSISLGKELYYSENKLISYKKYNNMVILGETTNYYNSTHPDNRTLVLLIDDSLENKKIIEYIADISLNYSDSAINVESFVLDIYFVSSLDRNDELYREFIISQTANRCDYNFYNEYSKKLKIINEFQEYRQWLPTKLSESYKNNYREYIKEKINEMNF